MHDSRLNPIVQYAGQNHVPIMQKTASDFLSFQTKILNPKEILEIGTAIGYSGSLMLLSCDARLTTLEIDENSFLHAKENFEKLGLSKRVVQILGNANNVIQDINKKFDLIFLDYAKAQYVKLLPRLIDLLNVGGVLVSDNVLFRGLISEEKENKRMKTIVKRMKQFLFDITNDERLESVIVPFCDGISLSRKVKE